MSDKRLLLFAAKLGYQTRSFEEAAKKLGVEIMYVTDRCHQLEDPWGDDAVAVHFEKPDAAAHTVLEAARSKNVDGILALGDRPLVAAAYVARGLGLLYNHPVAVEACGSKLRMREVFRQAGLPGPWFNTVSLNPPPEPTLLGIKYPCVLKPLSLSASQGVVRADNREEFNTAAARIKKLLASPEILALRNPNVETMLVEGYIPGKEVAVEAVMTAGELRILAIFDKPDALEGPYFEETIYVTPSRLSEETKHAIEKSTNSAAIALGLSHGPIHAEFRINEAGVWPLEVAPRPIGGLCSRALRFVAEEAGESMGLEELLLRHALELQGREARREDAASGVMMIPVPSGGRFEGVDGESDARKTTGITELHITARLHDAIAAWPEGSSYLGFIFAKGANAAEVESALRAAHQELKFKIVPLLPVQHPATKAMP
ncbi:MAG TPA: ATP-grasp domain-containing protein [Candidatus Eremiobacteraceae bacterium]|nr:ATP-grasp domain-containing protein [Candidatus Eremiobacteraceae bacterium]